MTPCACSSSAWSGTQPVLPVGRQRARGCCTRLGWLRRAEAMLAWCGPVSGLNVGQWAALSGQGCSLGQWGATHRPVRVLVLAFASRSSAHNSWSTGHKSWRGQWRRTPDGLGVEGW